MAEPETIEETSSPEVGANTDETQGELNDNLLGSEPDKESKETEPKATAEPKEKAEPKGEEKIVQREKTPVKKVEKEYQIKLTNDSVLSDDDLDSLNSYLGDHDLDEKTAKGTIKFAENIIGNYKSVQEEKFANQVEDWKQDTLNDPDIKGEGEAELKENISLAKKVIENYGGKELADSLTTTGLGNYKPFVKMMINIGKNLKDDKFVGGKKQDLREAKTLGEIFYGKS